MKRWNRGEQEQERLKKKSRNGDEREIKDGISRNRRMRGEMVLKGIRRERVEKERNKEQKGVENVTMRGSE